MTMPKLSLYKPEKGPDFRFLDRVINEQFQVGGVDIFVHKYLGPVDPEAGTSTPGVPTNTNPIGELGIQDLIFMENRDRHYDADIYQMRGIYTMQDIDFNLSQFGLFLQNDNIMITFHLRSTFDSLGRKLMSGDVLELPHLKDEYALDDSSVALKRFYVITDVTRASTGFSQTWYPHLIRAKCQPLVDSQEFKEILDGLAGDGDKTLRDVISTYNKNISINQAIIQQAELDSPASGYDTASYYVLPVNDNGLLTVTDTTLPADTSVETPALDASFILKSDTAGPNNQYAGYLTSNAIPPNGAPYTFGITFPNGPVIGQFHLRIDFHPNRLFKWNGDHWIKIEDNIRMTLDNFGYQDVAPGTLNEGKDVNKTAKGTFVNNNTTATINGKVVQQKQSLSKALKPIADNL
jgi:hypothetical protein